MKKYENFTKALHNLQDVNVYKEPYDNVTLTGLVALYSICFEQAWKAMKECLEEQGYLEEKLGSPRSIIKTAYKAGMIEDEEAWIGALLARNNVAHAYNQGIALKIIEDVKSKYLDLLEELHKNMEENWLG